MGKNYTSSEEAKKDFLQKFDCLCRSRSRWEVWEDVITAIACFINISVDHFPKHLHSRAGKLEQCVKRIGGLEPLSELLLCITNTLELNPEQDFLGELYMRLKLGDHWKGQFFTPYHISQFMAEVSLQNMDQQVESKGYVSVCDPTCGAGSLLIAVANKAKQSKYNFQKTVFFVGMDIDPIVAQMCYIQLSLLGCAGYICIGNSLTDSLSGNVLSPNELEGQDIWYTPMYFTESWVERIVFPEE